MKKPILFAVLMVILYSLIVVATSSFNIVVDEVNVTGSAGQTISSSFVVNNTGTDPLNIAFSGFALTSGNNDLVISSLADISNLAADQTATPSFNVVIPNQQPNGAYTGIVTGTSNASNTDTITINVIVTPTFSVSVNPSSIDLGNVALNTTQANIAFNITNTGNSDITGITFGFSDSNADLVANKSNFVLAFNSSENILFNMTVPADSSTGNVTLGSITIASAELNSNIISVTAEVGGGLIIEDLDIFLTTRIKRDSLGIRRSGSESDLGVTDGKNLDFDDEDAGPGSE